ncbi:hypothetical protein L596_002551 [Steinernema carpocapsae]|uniref:Uncharacterized protein n=1 Tax=Steinernema carpocapsae TaxID=34508 RepID=A0A4U8URF2_STECR|nr:hypothetical protein L596_002551 [Steinernema carpocapsae]
MEKTKTRLELLVSWIGRINKTFGSVVVLLGPRLVKSVSFRNCNCGIAHETLRGDNNKRTDKTSFTAGKSFAVYADVP